jgi:hypothetical protein
MTITIDIKPEVKAALSRRAAAQGIGLEPFAATLLEEAAQIGASSKTLDGDQLDRTLQELAQFSQKIPLLPDEAFSRESLYQDHD